MLVRIRKLSEDSQIPQKADQGSAGYDLCSLENKILVPGETHLFRIGFALEIPPEYEAQIRSRSGMSLKHQVIVLNSPGTIDSSYRGEIGVILHNFGKEPYEVKKGDRIAQMVFCSVPRVLFREGTHLELSDRGEKGFGSTGY